MSQDWTALEGGRESCAKWAEDDRLRLYAPCAQRKGHRGRCVPSVKGHRGHIPIPYDPWNEIAPNLFQGSAALQPTKDYFDDVLTLTSVAPAVGDGVAERLWLISDIAGDGDSEDADLENLEIAARWVSSRWHRGGRVLVRCQAGLNRSGLVVAATLVLNGAEVDEAVDLVRQKRSPYALCNSAFYALLREVDW